MAINIFQFSVAFGKMIQLMDILALPPLFSRIGQTYLLLILKAPYSKQFSFRNFLMKTEFSLKVVKIVLGYRYKKNYI